MSLPAIAPGIAAKIVLSAFVLTALGACGGGGGGGGSPPPPPPITPGDTIALTTTGRLLSFNRATPAEPRTAVMVSGLAAGETLLAIDIRPANGMLYGLTSAARLVTINTGTGVATQASILAADPNDASPTPNNAAYAGLTGTNFGMDFNPVVDRLRVVSNTGQNLRINVDSGLVISDGALTSASVVSTGVAAAGYTNSFGSTCRTALFYLDSTSDTLLTTSAPNDGVLTAVGALGVDGDAINGFEIATAANGSNAAFAVLSLAAGPTLHMINLTTGAATAVGVVTAAGTESIRGLAIAPPATAPTQAAGDLYGLTESNRLVSFNRAAPARLCTSVPIAPLATGEQVVGIDFRPSTGVLHALGNASGTGRLLTVDPATGAVTAPVAISVPLVGTDFGMDFNPTGPVALRIVSDTGQNLRVTDISTGATTPDTGLAGAGSGATAAAYNNSLAGAGSTTLFVLDSTTDRLNVQNPPNAGTLVDVGALGVDITGVNGFDIDGRNNQATIVVNVAPATTSSLHSLDLLTGAASASLGTVGGGERLRGITRPTPTTTVFGLTGTNQLVRLSLADPTMVTPVAAVTGLGTESLVGIDFRPSTGVLHGIGSDGGLFTIDPVTAVATSVPLAADPADDSAPFSVLDGSSFGVDFNPFPAGVPLRVVSDEEQNLRVGNLATGLTFTDADLARAPDLFGLSALAYTNSVTPNPTATVLYGLDAVGNRLVAVTPPNAGTVRVIGPTGVDVTPNSVMEIVGPATALSAGTAVAILDTLPANKAVYSINLSTGAATLIGSTDGPLDAFLGLAAPISATVPAADSLLFAVDSGNNLVSFARNAPGTRIADAGITGLIGTVVGIDFRSVGGLLWVLTRDALGVGRLFTIDASGVTSATTTVAATLVSTLVADAADTGLDGTPAYTTLNGATFGMDFNPLPAGVPLRIISNVGQNLRVTNPMTGATFTDGSGQPAPNVVAAAYSNNFATPSATLLYVIDTATGSLLLRSPPNDGTLSTIGALSAGDQYGLTAAFDIAGGANGIALAALQRTGETQSRLYRINLLTGTAIEVVAGALVGGATGVPITGLAVRVQ